MKKPLLLFLLSALATSALAYEPGRYYDRAITKEKVIALTFDDGPGAFTPQILDLLKQYGAQATFFIEGDQVAAYPTYVVKVLEAGHELANHTYSHRNFKNVKEKPAEVFEKELIQTEEAIRKALGNPGFKLEALRMPYGAVGPYNRSWLMPLLKNRGYALVHWSFGTDWFLKKSADQMAQEYLANSGRGSILLFHDGGRHREKTLAALQIILPELQKRGFRFVTSKELLSNHEKVAETSSH